MGKTKIFVIHDGRENYPALSSDIVTPILGGSESDIGEFGIRIPQRETSGDTICDRHYLYSEFTVYYWIWRNIIEKDQSVEQIGIFHYRTFLYLLKNKQSEGNLLERLGITEENISKLLSDYHAIITNVNKEEGFYDWTIESIYKQFWECHPLPKLLFDKSLVYLGCNKTYGDMVGPALEYFYKVSKDKEKYKPYFKSVFVARRGYFEEYMKYIDYMLGTLYTDKEVMEAVNTLNPPESKYRLFAFLGERLTALFIYYHLKERQDYNILEVTRYHQPDLKVFLNDAYPFKTLQNRQLLPLVRFYNPKKIQHVYIPLYPNKTDIALPQINEMGKNGFWVDGLVGYIWRDRSPGTRPLYMVQCESNDDYFYTTSEGEYLHAKQVLRYTKDFGIIGYLDEKSTGKDSVKLLRCYCEKTDMGRHFYTTDHAELENFYHVVNWDMTREEEGPGYIRMLGDTSSNAFIPSNAQGNA